MKAALRTRPPGAQSLAALLPAAAAAYGDAPALRFPAGGSVRTVSYRELDRASAAVRDRLLPDVRRGDRVIVSGENSPEWIAAFFGAIRAGAVPVPLDPGLDVERVRAVVVDAEPSAILADEAILARAGGLAPVASALDALGGGDGAGDRAEGEDVTPASDEMAVLIFTTGTMGRPKGVMLSHRGLIAQIDAVIDAARPVAGDALLLVLPLYHSFALTTGLLTPLAAGIPIELEHRPSRVRARLRSARPTLLIGVPALFEVLAREAQRQTSGIRGGYLRAALALNRVLISRAGVNAARWLLPPVRRALGGRLRLAVSGGAPLAADALRTLYALGIPVVQGYGLTEAGPVVSVQRFSSRAFWWSRRFWQQAGSVGAPVLGGIVRIAPVSGADAGEGEIVVSGDHVMLGYFRRPEATREAVRDGELHTGDLGRLDRRGELWITGRAKLAASTPAGKLVHLERVEAAIQGAAEVAGVRVTDEAGPPWRLVAHVFPSAMADPERASSEAEIRSRVRAAVTRRCRALLPYERVSEVRLIDEPLPRTPLGKPRRDSPPPAGFRLERWRARPREAEPPA